VQPDMQITIRMVRGAVAQKIYIRLFIRMSLDICDKRLFHLVVFTWHP